MNNLVEIAGKTYLVGVGTGSFKMSGDKHLINREYFLGSYCFLGEFFVYDADKENFFVICDPYVVWSACESLNRQNVQLLADEANKNFDDEHIRNNYETFTGKDDYLIDVTEIVRVKE